MPGATRSRQHESAMERPPPVRTRGAFTLLGLTALGLLAVYLVMPQDLRARTLLSSAAGTIVAAVAAAVVLRASGRQDAWASTRKFGWALIVLAVVEAGFFAVPIVRPPIGSLSGPPVSARNPPRNGCAG